MLSLMIHPPKCRNEKIHQLILGSSQKTQTQSVKLLEMDIDSKINGHDYINYISK